MRLLQAYKILLNLHQPIIQTADAAAALRVSPGHASQLCLRLAKEKLMVSLIKGRWAMGNEVDPLLVPSSLSSPAESYISLQTALYYHGMISQIPSVIYAVSLGRTASFHTPLGDFSLHHFAPEFFCGYEVTGNGGVLMATPEKALLDICYASSAKSRLFCKLPELLLPSHFDVKKARRFITRIPSRSRRTMVEAKLNSFLSEANS